MFSLFGLKRKKTCRPRRYNVPGSPCNKLRKNVCRSNPNCSYTKRGCRRRKGSLSSGDYIAPSAGGVGVARSWNPSWGPSPTPKESEFTSSGDDDLGAYGDEAGISFFGRRRRSRRMGFGGMMSPDAFGSYFGYRRKATKRRSTKRKTTKRKSYTKRKTTKRKSSIKRRYKRKSSSACSGLRKEMCESSSMCSYTKGRGCRRAAVTESTPDFQMTSGGDDDEDLGAYAEAAGITFFGRKRHCVRRKTKKCRKLPKAFVKKCRKYGIKTTKKVGRRRVPKKMSVIKKQLAKKMRKHKRRSTRKSRRRVRRSSFGFF